jgi:membrane protein
MKLIDPRTTYILKNPVAFALRVLKSFRANQGLLLAGAVAYYALLSIVPLLILIVIALSQVIDQGVLLTTLKTALEYVAPGEGSAVVAELKAFLDHREVIGLVLLVTMLFFSSLGFKVLESAISVIFSHRVNERKRHFLISLLLLPFGYIFFIGTVLFVGTFVIVDLMAIGGKHVVILGHTWSLGGFSHWLIYVAGVCGEILLISAIYFFMPVGRVTVHHALIAGERGVWLAHHRHRRAAQPGTGRHAAVAGRTGNRRIRAHRNRLNPTLGYRVPVTRKFWLALRPVRQPTLYLLVWLCVPASRGF